MRPEVYDQYYAVMIMLMNQSYDQTSSLELSVMKRLLSPVWKAIRAWEDAWWGPWYELFCKYGNDAKYTKLLECAKNDWLEEPSDGQLNTYVNLAAIVMPPAAVAIEVEWMLHEAKCSYDADCGMSINRNRFRNLLRFIKSDRSRDIPRSNSVIELANCYWQSLMAL